MSLISEFITSLLNGFTTGMIVMLAYFFVCWILGREFPSFRKKVA